MASGSLELSSNFGGGGGGGSGTVTSVGLTVPSFLSITGSPVTTSGTMAVTYSGTALPVANGGTGVTALGSLTDAGTDGITVTGGTGAVISNVSLSQQKADSTHNGYLSSTDWSTFNGKQASGSYITALTGDVTASGPGSSAATVALVGGSSASNVNTATVLVNTAQSGNKFLASPSNGSSAAPAFRVIATADIPSNQIIGSFGITIDGGGSVPSTGSKGYLTVPYAGTITNWYLAANASGSCVIDVKRSGSSIVGGGGNKPTLSSAQSGNAAVSSWTSTAVSAGDIIEFNLDSVTTITRVNLVIKMNKT